MSAPFSYPDRPIDRGKVLWEEDLEKLKEEWGRYKDIDGDFIPYRTVPGNRHPQGAYFARGTGHDDFANYSEKPADWERNLNRIKNKVFSSTVDLPGAVIHEKSGAKRGLIAFGSTDSAVQEALDYLEQDGIKLNYLRVRSLPPGDDVLEFIRSQERVYVVENNRDGQMHRILRHEVPEKALDVISLAHIDGLPLSAEWIKSAVMEEESK
jgi:2-oxoglutarate ferredoxin oxidoreductase subunit alpha